MFRRGADRSWVKTGAALEVQSCHIWGEATDLPASPQMCRNVGNTRECLAVNTARPFCRSLR